jgi:hypothetical protein
MFFHILAMLEQTQHTGEGMLYLFVLYVVSKVTTSPKSVNLIQIIANQNTQISVVKNNKKMCYVVRNVFSTHLYSNLVGLRGSRTHFERHFYRQDGTSSRIWGCSVCIHQKNTGALVCRPQLHP